MNSRTKGKSIGLFVLRLFFFPDFLGRFGSDREKADYISGELYERAID